MERVVVPGQERDCGTVKQLLRAGVVNGLRGEKNFYPSSAFALPVSDIIKVTTTGNKIHNIIPDQGKGMRYDANAF